MIKKSTVKSEVAGPIRFEANYITEAPFYHQVGPEVNIFLTAALNRDPRTGKQAPLPVLLKGPTGCGKTRLVEYMAYTLKRPLITVPGHEDLSKDDLVGKPVLDGLEGKWQDGPLKVAAEIGGIFYFDEFVEARPDTTVVIHPLADHRRQLPVDVLGVIYKAHENFMLVVSYNPGYQSIQKSPKPSTKQRFVSIPMSYPPPNIESIIVQKETGIGKKEAGGLVEIARKIRSLKTDSGIIEEGCSTRLLIYAANLLVTSRREKIKLTPAEACAAALRDPVTDDTFAYDDIEKGIGEVLAAYFE